MMKLDGNEMAPRTTTLSGPLMMMTASVVLSLGWLSVLLGLGSRFFVLVLQEEKKSRVCVLGRSPMAGLHPIDSLMPLYDWDSLSLASLRALCRVEL
jgi:hypothetical protein